MIEHTPDDGPGALGRALRLAGIALRLHRVRRDGPPPAGLAGLAGVAVLGGGMSARSTSGFATRDAELRLLEAALRAELPVLGICLGAQLLTLAAGGRVYRGAEKEIGFVAVERLPAGASDPIFGPAPAHFTALNWHEDGCEPPPQAVRLARSATYPVQGFRIGRLAYGVQFHPEAGRRELAAWIREAPGDAARAPGGGAGLLSTAGPRLAALAPVRQVLLGGFAELVRTRPAVAA